MRVLYVSKGAVRCIGLAATLCLLGSNVTAQTASVTTPAQPKAKQSDTLSFAQAFEMLSKRYQVAFVVEEEPFSQTGVSLALLSPVAGDGSNPLDAVVERVAAAFDYQAEKSGNIVLLRKRFTDENDLPSVTLPECYLATRDIVRVMNRLNPHVPPVHVSQGKPISPLTRNFMLSLTPDQFLAMYNGTEEAGLRAYGKPIRGVLPDGSPLAFKQPSSKGVVEVGLAFKNLTSTQQNEIRRVANYFYIQLPTAELESSLPHLEDMAAIESPVFRFIIYTYEQSTWRLFGYEEKGTAGDKTKFHTILIERVTQANRAQVPAARGEDYELVGKKITKIQRQDAKEVTVFLAAFGAIPLVSSETPFATGIKKSQTIAQIIAAWNVHANSADTKIAADDTLQEKRITLIGADSLSGPVLLQAIARLYNFRTEQATDKTIRLTRLRVSALANVADVPATLERLLPAPLLRAAQADKVRATKPKRIATGGGTSYTTNTMRYTAAQKLNAIVQEKAKKSPDGTLQLSDLGEEGRRALAIICMQGLEPVRRLIAEPVPDYVANVEGQRFAGGLSLDPENRIRFALFFSTGPGVGNVPYNW